MSAELRETAMTHAGSTTTTKRRGRSKYRRRRGIASLLITGLFFAVACTQHVPARLQREKPDVTLSDDGSWCWFQDERAIVHGDYLIVGSVAEREKVVPSESSRVTYSNLFWIPGENGRKGRIYNFFRGQDNSFKPSFSWSDDLGITWQTGSVFMQVPLAFRHRRYVKDAGDGPDTIHMVYTTGHPRDFDNSAYPLFYRSGMSHRSDGTPIRSLQEGLRRPEEGTRLFQADASHVAWSRDPHLDAMGHPHLVFTVQKDGAGKPPDEHGLDLRYHDAQWDATRWQEGEIVHAGTRLYQREAHYTGNASLDPDNRTVVSLSTNAHPATGEPRWLARRMENAIGNGSARKRRTMARPGRSHLGRWIPPRTTCGPWCPGGKILRVRRCSG